MTSVGRSAWGAGVVQPGGEEARGDLILLTGRCSELGPVSPAVPAVRGAEEMALTRERGDSD